MLLCVCMCASVCVSGVCAVIHSNTKRSRRAVRIIFHKQPLNLAATRTIYRTTAAAVHRQPVVLQALDFVPVVTVNVCMVDAQQQEIEPQHDTFSSPTQQPNTHRQTSHTRYTNLYSSKSSSTYCTYRWNACVPHFRLATPSGYHANPIPKEDIIYRIVCIRVHGHGATHAAVEPRW